MTAAPSWMSERRRTLLRRLRRERTRDEASASTASERYERACALLALARSVDPPPARVDPGTDEPPELWLALLARYRRQTEGS